MLLNLNEFFPYRLSRLEKAVSDSVAQVYRDRFGLARQEWRVLAMLGERAPLSAKAIGLATGLDKMQVSRAVNRLRDLQWVARKADARDRRASALQLTEEGRGVYCQIVPLVTAAEAEILGVLSAEEQHLLSEAMERLFRHLDNGGLDDNHS